MSTGINTLNSFPYRFTNVIKENAQLNIPLERYLNTHSGYSVDEVISF